MEMTIEEAIYCMQSYLPSDDYTLCTECKYYGCNTNGTCKSNEAHQKAVDIMRKYQKIQEIVRWNNAPSPYYKPDGQLFREICEVLEDGNDR